MPQTVRNQGHELSTVIRNANIWREVRRQRKFDLDNLSLDDIKELREQIECDLSPENLTCDGELSESQVRAKKVNLERALVHLTSIERRLKG